MKTLIFGIAIGIVVIAVLILGGIAVFSVPGQEITTSELYQFVENGEVMDLTIDSSTVIGSFKSGEKFKTTIVDTGNLEKLATAKGIKVTVIAPHSWWWWILWFVILGLVAQILLFVGLVWWSKKHPSSLAGQLSSNALHQEFRKKLLNVKKPTTKFADVAGYEEVKEELWEILDFLKSPEKYRKMGARIPRGVLMIGAPGTGKTLCAKAVAGEAEANFIALNGSDIEEVFVGVGAGRIRELFDVAKQNAPCIIFIDEFESLARRRSNFAMDGATLDAGQTVAELLHCMDGFETDERVIVLAATNRPEVLDPAVLRGDRIDRKIFFESPDVRVREEILKVHTKNKPLAPDVDLAKVARATTMLSGADLETAANEAAILAVRKGSKEITQDLLMEGVEKSILGPSKKNKLMLPKTKEVTAYHEAGHTLVAKLLRDADQPRKVTIIGRGPTGGATWFVPKEDNPIKSKSSLLAELAVGMGGRAAEMLKFKEETSGARGDFQKDTDIATEMVCEYGMNEKVGKVIFAQSHGFLGGSSEIGNCSEETRKLIDQEIKKLLDDAYDQAIRLITENLPTLDALAQALLEKESLNETEINDIFNKSKTSA